MTGWQQDAAAWRRPTAPQRPPPDDTVEGADPAVRFKAKRRITLYACNQCEHEVTAEHRDNHAVLHHPAYRNPELCCQDSPPWDHERWCIRPKGHEGDHWTPAHDPNGRWWP